MSGRFNFITLLSTSTAFAVATFSALQYIQVTPLEAKVAVLEEKLKSQKSQILVSVEYRQLQDQLSREKAIRELVEKQLIENKNELNKIPNLLLEIANANEQLEKYKNQNDYYQVKQDLAFTRQQLSALQGRYNKAHSDYKNLQSFISLRQDYDELKEQKNRLTTIIGCMNKASCPRSYLNYYVSDFDQAKYEQFRSELREVDSQIRLIIEKMPAI